MATEYFATIATELGVSIWLLSALVVWTLTWKLIALWKSARKGSIIWFIVLAIFNTVGVLPILYIFVFSHMHSAKPVVHRSVYPKSKNAGAKKKPAKKKSSKKKK